MGIQRFETTNGHWYKLDGRKADGVTTLLKKGLPPTLHYWSARRVAEHVADNLDAVAAMRGRSRDDIVEELKEVPWKEARQGAAKGTDVHRLAARLVHGHEVEVPEHLAGYVESCVRFMDDWRIEPVFVESVVANRRWNYAGSFDLVADNRKCEPAIYDYKTGASGIWPETAYQLAAYAHAETALGADGTEFSMSDLKIEAGYAVWLRADGYDVYKVDIGEQTYKAFLHIAYVARQRESMQSLLGPALPHPEDTP